MWEPAELATLIEPSIGKIYRHLRRRLAEEGRSHGLTPTQTLALRMLASEGAMRMTELAGRLDLSGSACTTMIEQLEKRGLVERGLDAADRRATRVMQTPEGQAIDAGILAHVYGDLARAVGRLSLAERHMVLGGFAALASVID